MEINESYFGGVGEGEWRRKAAGKRPVLGLLKRGGEVGGPCAPTEPTRKAPSRAMCSSHS